MALEKKSYRLDAEDIQELQKQAKLRGYDSDAALLRTFVKNGLANFDPRADKLMDLTKQLEELTSNVRDLAAANLFLMSRDAVLKEPRAPGETDEAYAKRQQERLLHFAETALAKGKTLGQRISTEDQKR